MDYLYKINVKTGNRKSLKVSNIDPLYAQINIEAAKNKAQGDLDKARRDIALHINSNSHEVHGGPSNVNGLKVTHIDLLCDRFNIIFDNGTHLTVQSNPYDRDSLEFTSMEQGDAVRFGLVPEQLLKELDDKAKAVELVVDEEKQIKDLCKLVDKLGKETILKLLGAS